MQKGDDGGIVVGRALQGLTGPGSAYPWDIRSNPDYQLMKLAPPGQKSIAQITQEYFATNPHY
jgi:hypothetical protein